MSWLIPRNELTIEQLRAIDMDMRHHHAICGGPGTGKTQILLHRARYLCDTYDIQPDRFKVLVFTKVLKDYIKSALSDLGLPEDAVLTFDHWCSDYYQKNIAQSLPRIRRNLDFVAIRQAAMSRASKGPILYDFVLVDEGQDLETDIFSFLTKISSHITVCLDHKQQIYDRGSSETPILEALGIRRRDINLIDAYRVCPYIVDVAASLIKDPDEREAFRNQSRQPQVEIQPPLIYYASDFEKEKQVLYQMIKERQLKNERIALLLPQNRQVIGFAKGLMEVGIDVEVPAKHGRMDIPTHNFASDRPKVLTYHSAKGLTFDSVFLPRLVEDSFRMVSGERIEKLLFVGITRATNWCYLSATEYNPLSILEDKIIPLATQRKITFMKGDQHLLPRFNAPATKTPRGDLDFL